MDPLERDAEARSEGPPRAGARRREAPARTRARAGRERAYREGVCEAAERLFAERGIEATKVEEVAAEAGLSLATLYSVFEGGKAQLVRRIHQQRLGELVGFALDEARGSGAPVERLERSVRSAVAFFMAHPHYLRMHLREGHAWCLPEAVAARTREGAEGWSDGVGAMIGMIEQAIAEGAVRCDDARRTGKAVVMLQQLHLAQWIEGGETEPFEAVFDRYWRDVEALLGLD